MDPAIVVYNDTLEGQILAITNDGLLSYDKVGGPDGATLVPDLASALPEVSTDGLTYRFPLREGIVYSTGEPVRPEDFRHALERTFAIGADGARLFNAIDGAKACIEEPSTCDLSGSIVADAEAVTFHLVRPDPELPFKLALPAAYPVPVEIPAKDQGLEPVPATGPYMIAEAGADGVELVRNPEFREWSGAAQPDGFVDAISWRFGQDPANAFDRLSAGELDWMTDVPQPEDLASLQAEHPDQVVLWPNAATTWIGFNVLAPPFDDVRVRQALNYAIDRGHVVELHGGRASYRPTCQVLPPNFQGYEPFCPYTLDPDSGAWSAPDLDRARALIEDAGAMGEKVTVWVADDPMLSRPGRDQSVHRRGPERARPASGPEDRGHGKSTWVRSSEPRRPDRKRDRQVYLGRLGNRLHAGRGFIEFVRCAAIPNAAPHKVHREPRSGERGGAAASADRSVGREQRVDGHRARTRRGRRVGSP